MYRVTVAAIALLLFAAAAGAQTVTVTKDAPIYGQPSPPADVSPLRVAAVGTILELVGQDGEWIQVTFRDPQLGESVGWVKSEFVTIQSHDLEPMDLSITPLRPPPSQTPSETGLSKPPTTRPSTRRERVWIDVNFGVASSGADLRAFTYTGVVYGEPYSFAAAYPRPSLGAEFDFGGGFMFTPVIGLGLSFTGTAQKDIVGLGATIPDPYYYDNEVTAAGSTTDRLVRSEGGVNIQAMIVALHRQKVSIRVFGGPTYFRYSGDMVRDIEFSQSASYYYPANEVEITGYESVTTEGTGWGFHVGGDVSYFFARIVGVGAFGRYSYGKVTAFEPMSESDQEMVVGGFQLGGGLRLRF